MHDVILSHVRDVGAKLFLSQTQAARISRGRERALRGGTNFQDNPPSLVILSRPSVYRPLVPR